MYSNKEIQATCAAFGGGKKGSGAPPISMEGRRLFAASRFNGRGGRLPRDSDGMASAASSAGAGSGLGVMDSRSSTVSLKLTRRTRLVAVVGVAGGFWSGMLCDLRSPPLPPPAPSGLDPLLKLLFLVRFMLDCEIGGAEAREQHFRCNATTRRLNVAKASAEESSMGCGDTGKSAGEDAFKLSRSLST